MLIHEAPLEKTARALRSGAVALPASLRAALDRVERLDPQVQALLPEPGRRERLLGEAQRLIDRYRSPDARPPLFGVLVGVKDVLRVDRLPTRAGSALPPELFAGPEADVVALLRRAGALVLGKTVSTEFAHSEPGPTRNPHAPEHTPGGSSSGSAAAVAAGFCPLALGTQTVGSVIRPASFCGVVGFKPSQGRVPAGGLVFFSRTADQIGWFTQDAEGLALASSVICPDWRPDAVRQAAARRPVIAVPEGPYLAQASAGALAVLEAGVTALIRAGFEIRALPAMKDIAEINAVHRRLVAAELAAEHREWFAAYRRLYRERTATTILLGQGVLAAEAESARASRLELRARLDSLISEHGIDLWISPSAPGPAPLGLESTGDPVMNLPWTHAGVPAVSIPAGLAEGRLPVGLQFAAGFGLDEALTGWAPGLAGVLRSAGGG